MPSVEILRLLSRLEFACDFWEVGGVYLHLLPTQGRIVIGVQLDKILPTEWLCQKYRENWLGCCFLTEPS